MRYIAKRENIWDQRVQSCPHPLLKEALRIGPLMAPKSQAAKTETFRINAKEIPSLALLGAAHAATNVLSAIFRKR